MEPTYVLIPQGTNVTLLNEQLILAYGLPTVGEIYPEYIPVTAGDPENGIVPLYDWAIRVPAGATVAEIEALIAQVNTDTTLTTKAQRLRAKVAAIYASAVGITVAQLTTNQLKAVLTILLWQAGLVDEELRVLPMPESIDDQF